LSESGGGDEQRGERGGTREAGGCHLDLSLTGERGYQLDWEPRVTSPRIKSNPFLQVGGGSFCRNDDVEGRGLRARSPSRESSVDQFVAVYERNPIRAGRFRIDTRQEFQMFMPL